MNDSERWGIESRYWKISKKTTDRVVITLFSLDLRIKTYMV